MHPLISAQQLRARLESGDDLVVVDCQHDLSDHSAGFKHYQSGHIPGAKFWNMECNGVAVKTGKNGRHPLPERADLVRELREFGITSDTHVVAYDAQANMYAARIWWLLRWIGHEKVSLLDGGLNQWKQAGFALWTGAEPGALKSHNHESRGSPLSLRASLVSWVDQAQVTAMLDSASSQLVDARAPERFRGEVEPLDPIAGHIPGALNRFYQHNLNADGRFKSPWELWTEFSNLLKGRKPTEVIHQCGSGVTACHNIVAMELAGLSGSCLYPGSWSEWCSRENAPVARSN